MNIQNKNKFSKELPICIGIDLAHSKGNQSAVMFREGNTAHAVTGKSADFIIDLIRELENASQLIDDVLECNRALFPIMANQDVKVQSRLIRTQGALLQWQRRVRGE